MMGFYCYQQDKIAIKWDNKCGAKAQWNVISKLDLYKPNKCLNNAPALIYRPETVFCLNLDNNRTPLNQYLLLWINTHQDSMVQLQTYRQGH